MKAKFILAKRVGKMQLGNERIFKKINYKCFIIHRYFNYYIAFKNTYSSWLQIVIHFFYLFFICSQESVVFFFCGEIKSLYWETKKFFSLPILNIIIIIKEFFFFSSFLTYNLLSSSFFIIIFIVLNHWKSKKLFKLEISTFFNG